MIICEYGNSLSSIIDPLVMDVVTMLTIMMAAFVLLSFGDRNERNLNNKDLNNEQHFLMLFRCHKYLYDNHSLKNDLFGNQFIIITIRIFIYYSTLFRSMAPI